MLRFLTGPACARTLRDVDGLQLGEVVVQDQSIVAAILLHHAKINGTVQHSGNLAAARVRVRRVAGAGPQLLCTPVCQ
jgi:hypothetical protein